MLVDCGAPASPLFQGTNVPSAMLYVRKRTYDSLFASSSSMLCKDVQRPRVAMLRSVRPAPPIGSQLDKARVLKPDIGRDNSTMAQFIPLNCQAPLQLEFYLPLP